MLIGVRSSPAILKLVMEYVRERWVQLFSLPFILTTCWGSSKSQDLDVTFRGSFMEHLFSLTILSFFLLVAAACNIALKRGRYIGKVNSLLQEFHFASTDVLLKLLSTYTTSFYGSQLWDIYSNNCEKLYKSWNVSMRNILGIDRRSHRYLLEDLTGQVHPKVMLASRLVGFYNMQLNSKKLKMRFIERWFYRSSWWNIVFFFGLGMISTVGLDGKLLPKV